MGLFDKLKNSFSSGKLQKEQIDRLRESIWTAVADGQIDDRELEYINGFYKESELSPEEFQKLCSEIFVSVVQQAISDRRVGQAEINSINNIIDRLQIPADLEAWAQRQIQYFAVMSSIEAGGPLPSGSPTGLILKKDELCHVSLPGLWLEERVVSRNYAGGSQGVNLRIMKGVSYRIGQQKGQMQSQTGMVVISEGYFVITNKRLVFSGDRKSVSTPFSKLLDVNVFADGIGYSFEGRQKAVIVKLGVPEESEICALIISRIINENV